MEKMLQNSTIKNTFHQKIKQTTNKYLNQWIKVDCKQFYLNPRYTYRFLTNEEMFDFDGKKDKPPDQQEEENPNLNYTYIDKVVIDKTYLEVKTLTQKRYTKENVCFIL